MVKTRRRISTLLTRLGVAAALGAASPAALGTPAGGEFVTNPGWGDILIQGPAGQTITSVFLPGLAVDPSNRHIINWTSLNLGAAETLKFIGADGYMVMNRIPGMGTPTLIDGLVQAPTGSVYVVNAAGVMFGQNAVISAAGFHAAAASWSEGDQLQADFLSGGPLTFHATGEVHNAGSISVSDKATLIGTRVEQTGSMSGRVLVLAVGNQITLDDLGSRVSITIDGSTFGQDFQPGNGGGASLSGDPALLNTGTLTATPGGQVSLAAGDMLGLAIQHSGQIVAPSGEVSLQASTGAVWIAAAVPGDGLIDVSDDDQAGSIDLAGEAVVHDGMALARGAEGAISMRSDANTIIGAGSVLVADAGLIDGDAGAITLSSSNGTVAVDQQAFISATGGVMGGDGGTVTMEAAALAVVAPVKLTSTFGQAGTLRLISDGNTLVDATGDGVGPIDTDALSTSLIEDGQYGRIGAAAGQTLGVVEGVLLVESGQDLRIEAGLDGLQDESTLRGDTVTAAIDGGGSIRAPSLTIDGLLSVQADTELVGVELLDLRGGAVGDGVSSLSISSDELVRITDHLGSPADMLGSLFVGTGSGIHLLQGETDFHAFHVAGSIDLAGAAEGASDPAFLSAERDIVMYAGGDVSFGAFGTQLHMHDGQGIEVRIDGALTNNSNFNVDGPLLFEAASIVNLGALQAGSIDMHAINGSLQNFSTIASVGDVWLRSSGDLTNSAAVTGAGVLLQSQDGRVASAAALTADHVTMDAATGIELDAGVEAADWIALRTSAGQIVVDQTLQAGTDISVVSESGTVETTVALQGRNIHLEGQDIHVQAAVAAEQRLTADAAGSLQVDADLSADEMTLEADVTQLGGAALRAEGELTIAANQITLTADATLDASTLSIDGLGDDLAAVALAGHDLALTASDTLDLGARVDGQGSLRADAGQQLLLGGDLGASEAIGSIALSSPDLRLQHGVEMIAATADIELNAESRDAFDGGLPTISVWGEGVSIVSEGGDITVGNNQGVAALGDVTLDAAGMLAVGDLTAAGNVTLRGGTVQVWRRGPQVLQTGDGLTYSTQTSVVAGGRLTVDGTVSFAGTGGDPSFAGFDGTVGVDGVDVNAAQAFTAADLEVRTASGPRLTLVSLQAAGQSSDDQDLVAAESQQQAADVEFSGSTPVRATAEALAEDFGIELVDGVDRPAGYGRMARAGHVIDDLGGGGDLIQVSRSRLSDALATIAIDSYDRAMTPAEGAQEPAAVLRETYTAWREAVSEGETEDTWKQWLRAGDDAPQRQASRIVAELDTAFDMLRRAGLTRAEVEASRRWVGERLGTTEAPIQLAAATARAQKG